MAQGDIVRDEGGRLYYAWSARFSRLDVMPMVDGKPVVHSSSAIRYALDDPSRLANPHWRAEALYLHAPRARS